MNRRQFLATVTASVATAAPRARTLVAGHPYVYTQHRADKSLYAALDEVFPGMKSAGLDAIELMSVALEPDGAVERIRELSRRHSLPVLGTSFSGNMWDRERHAAILKDATSTLERLQKVGGRTFGISVGSARKPKTPEQFDAQAELLRKIMTIAADHGVVPNLHNHTYEVENGEHDLNGTLERIPEIKLGPDFNWLLRAKVDPVDFIRRRGKQIVFAHLRDQKADGKWPDAMGEGSMDYAAIGRALRKTGFKGDLAIELAHERDFTLTRPLSESFKLSREYVRRTMGY